MGPERLTRSDNTRCGCRITKKNRCRELGGHQPNRRSRGFASWYCVLTVQRSSFKYYTMTDHYKAKRQVGTKQPQCHYQLFPWSINLGYIYMLQLPKCVHGEELLNI